MKIAVTGKGGVGKTTVCALLSFVLKQRGLSVVAIDADPNACLAACMGYPDPSSIRPLSEMKELIEERTGVAPGSIGGMFQLNPFVEDIAARYSVEIAGVNVLVAGAVKSGGAGCYCPENALLRALVSHLLTESDVALVLDMEAGLEHLSRGTVRAVDALLVVMEPSMRGVETAHRIRKLAGDIGLTKLYAVGNKIRAVADEEFLRKALPGWEFAAFLPYDAGIAKADMDARAVMNGAGPGTIEAVGRLAGFITGRQKLD